MNQIRKSEDTLIEIEFSKFEAATFIFLLQHSPSTGYKVAKGIGTSYSNAYKILKSLEKKGYVLAEKGDNNRYRAIPIDEVLNILEKKFNQRKNNLADAIADLPLIENDQRIY
ncbi:MAG TPA: helix-turn-helix domain-containing protein [Acidobacteriota bacterium]|nr:helix-turn-helix domain-containing protein [Acidobacteriota bacterium]